MCSSQHELQRAHVSQHIPSWESGRLHTHQDKNVALRGKGRPLTCRLPTSSGLTQRKDFGANCSKEEKPSVWEKARDGDTQRWTWM